jgi:hypothetical protein
VKGVDTAATSQAMEVALGSSKVTLRPPKGRNVGKKQELTGLQQASSDAIPVAREPISQARRKPKSKLDSLSLPQAEMAMLQSIQDRCESVGVKIKKTQLLVAALHLLSSMPMGKFLAVVGPLESVDHLAQVKKKRPRA